MTTFLRLLFQPSQSLENFFFEDADIAKAMFTTTSPASTDAVARLQSSSTVTSWIFEAAIFQNVLYLDLQTL